MRLRTQSEQRHGAVIVYAALTMTVLIGLAALAIDIGFKHDRLRHVQAAADASALAGAADLYKRWNTSFGVDSTGQAESSCLNIASANGYTHTADGTSIEVHIPPTSGPNVGKRGYVEVIISKQDTRFFSRIYSSSNLVTKARAVARASFDVIGEGVIVLDLHGKNALNAHGGGIMTLKGAPFIVNSDHTEAAITNGSEGAQLRAPEFRITGSYTETGSSTFADSNGGVPAPIVTGTPPTPDPLAYLPAPTAAGMPAGTISSQNIPGSGGVKNITLTPGYYPGGLSFTGKDNVTMQPGVYYMDNGGFNFSGQGNLTANGVMIYNDTNASNSQQVSITGQGTVQMSPPSSGVYKGILVFQERISETSINIVGNGNFTIGGTFYAANAQVNISGNGDSYIGSQYISRYLDIGGNGSLNIDYTAAPHPSRRVLQLVE